MAKLLSPFLLHLKKLLPKGVGCLSHSYTRLVTKPRPDPLIPLQHGPWVFCLSLSEVCGACPSSLTCFLYFRALFLSLWETDLLVQTHKPPFPSQQIPAGLCSRLQCMETGQAVAICKIPSGAWKKLPLAVLSTPSFGDRH